MGGITDSMDMSLCKLRVLVLDSADDTTFMAESEEEIKRLLLKVKEENEKVGLKPNIQKTKIMASSPITAWEIDKVPLQGRQGSRVAFSTHPENQASS